MCHFADIEQFFTSADPQKLGGVFGAESIADEVDTLDCIRPLWED